MKAVYRMTGMMMVALAMSSVTITPAAATEQNAVSPSAIISDDVVFEYSWWSAAMIALLENGPRILPEDFPIEIPPPFKNSSAETAEELAFLKKIATIERTESQVKKIQSEDRSSSLHMIFEEEGLFNITNYPLTSALIESVDSEILYFAVREKRNFKRARPSQLAPDLTTVIDVPKHAAYPSGHAAQSYAHALVLAEIDSANADKYKQLALDIAHRREIAGVHYPSDSKAGQMLAEQVVKAVFETPQIQKRLALAKKEFETQ